MKETMPTMPGSGDPQVPTPKSYRDELAQKLKDTRNAGPEGKAKAQGYLEAKQETAEYKTAEKLHIKEASQHRISLEVNRLSPEAQKRFEIMCKDFDKQVETFLKLEYVRDYMHGIDRSEEFRQTLEPLKRKLIELSSREFPEGHIPFIVVPGDELVSIDRKLASMGGVGARGAFSSKTDFHPSAIKNRNGVDVPTSRAYLLVDVENSEIKFDETTDYGDGFNLLNKFKKEGRVPLTAQEGVVLVTQNPDVLKREKGLHFIGSSYEDHAPGHSGNMDVYMYRSGDRPVLDSTWPYSWHDISESRYKKERIKTFTCEKRIGI